MYCSVSTEQKCISRTLKVHQEAENLFLVETSTSFLFSSETAHRLCACAFIYLFVLLLLLSSKASASAMRRESGTDWDLMAGTHASCRERSVSGLVTAARSDCDIKNMTRRHTQTVSQADDSMDSKGMMQISAWRRGEVSWLSHIFHGRVGTESNESAYDHCSQPRQWVLRYFFIRNKFRSSCEQNDRLQCAMGCLWQKNTLINCSWKSTVCSLQKSCFKLDHSEDG